VSLRFLYRALFALTTVIFAKPSSKTGGLGDSGHERKLPCCPDARFDARAKFSNACLDTADDSEKQPHEAAPESCHHENQANLAGGATGTELNNAKHA
jgi:hypothetical protein